LGEDIKQNLQLGVNLSRKKDKSELEHLRGIIRELEKENRQLRQRLKHAEKWEVDESTQDDGDTPKDSEDTLPKLLTADCDNCGRGKLVQSLELRGKIYGTCNICKANGRIK
jgi:hypothetical protein